MEALIAKLSDSTILIAILVIFAIVAVVVLRKTLKKIGIGPSGATVETHSASDLASVRKIDAAGTDIKVSARGRGSSVEDVKIDRASKNIDINSSTQ
ncbi:hypothetical protein [Bradyrhizobium genosp. A]|uniref:hypothetical protein n=1 Tax=Bradyrhizobium genosp. A TaxID=83626 RepID=UPI003CE7442B